MSPGGGLMQLNAYGCFDTFLTGNCNTIVSYFNETDYILEKYKNNKHNILPKRRYVNFTIEINEKKIDRSKLTILDKIKLTADILLNS